MPNLTTTIGHLKKFSPYKESYRKYISSIDKFDDDTEISLSSVLKICGIKDACWFLRCFEYKKYSLFCADVAESVLYIFEDKFNGR